MDTGNFTCVDTDITVTARFYGVVLDTLAVERFHNVYVGVGFYEIGMTGFEVVYHIVCGKNAVSYSVDFRNVIIFSVGSRFSPVRTVFVLVLRKVVIGVTFVADKSNTAVKRTLVFGNLVKIYVFVGCGF